MLSEVRTIPCISKNDVFLFLPKQRPQPVYSMINPMYVS